MKASDGQEPSTTDRAVEFIRDAIIDGTFPAESMLSEGDLAGELGISRTPVRVALARLQDEGWVRIYPKRGAMVRGLSPEELTDLVHARFVLESSGVRLASTDVRTRLADDLAPLVDEQRNAFAAGDVPQFIELTLAFHDAFIRMGANRYLIDLGERLAGRQRWMLFANQALLAERSDQIIAEHEELLDGLRDHDTTRFTDVLHAHVTEDIGRAVGSP